MVNSGSFDSDSRQGDRNAKVGFTQPHSGPDSTQSPSPVTASVATSCKTDFSQTADGGLPSVAHAIEPTPTKTEFNSDMPVEKFTNLSSIDGPVEESEKPPEATPSDDEKTSLCCSLPLEKVQEVLTPFYPPPTKADEDGVKPKQPARKLLCLYCDRSFVSANLRQKHVERVHSARQNRRVSSRRQNQLTVTPCVYCDKLNSTENTLKDLFQHLINEHSSKYFGCLPCEDRFLTLTLLADHNASKHQTNKTTENTSESNHIFVEISPVDIASKLDSEGEENEEIPVKITRSKLRPKSDAENKCKKTVINKKKSTKLKELRAKKLSVKSSRMALKRRESKRLQAIAKIAEAQKKKRPKPTERKQSNVNKSEQANSTKSTEKSKSNSTSINPYPEFDHFYRVKKITDHSIDNLKISSLTFDDVFDKAFFNRIKCNIEENLLHHIDGKLFKNEESESRISNFEKVSNIPQEIQSTNSENYGCELSLNAVTPVASLSLTSQFGEDFESQIEYGSKPSKKKIQTRKDEFHYKYFTRRKYQASILEHKENRDLSKLDMWTQLVIKRRQQKMLDDRKSAKEILEYTTCDEYKSKLRKEELNRILDRRGPFEDLKEEASKKAALDKLNLASTDNISQESFTEVREVLNEILNRVFAGTEDLCVEIETIQENQTRCDGKKQDVREIPGYLNLRRSSSLPSEGEIDKSDRIALICSSQETENFELPTNQVRGKNELVELTGEWARCRMYICAACGAKLPNMKFLLEHKSLYHQNVWVQHYEFVGNQSELYRHLSIPVLGKVGAVEESVQCKTWRRSDARVCTKCGKQCNALAELHRHILECGGDWTWMLARKKCKYRPFGAKSRRKRRGLIHRIHHKRKTEPTEKKTYKKRFDGPRQRPSDADTIQRMLANLPAKRSTRKLISLYDGIYRARKNTQININQKKVKCGKVIYKTTNRKATTEKTINTSTGVKKSQKCNLSSNRRSLRTLNKVLASRILDTNTKLTVKRKLKAINDKRRTRQSRQAQEKIKETDEEHLEETSIPVSTKSKLKVAKRETKDVPELESASKRTSPRSSPQNVKQKITVKKLLTGNISIKSFFPVKKRKHKKDVLENQNVQLTTSETENIDIKTRSKRKSKEISELEEEKKDEIVNTKTEPKKTKNDTFGNLVRSFSFHSRKNAKNAMQNKTETNISKASKDQTVCEGKQAPVDEKKEENKAKLNKKRKLKRSIRSVINKVKKVKIDDNSSQTLNAEEISKPNDSRIAFLEEGKQEQLESLAQAEKIVTPSTLEANENIADISAPIVMTFDSNENPPIPETIFNLESNDEKNLQAKCELEFDNQPLQATDENDSNKIEDNVNKSKDESACLGKGETILSEKELSDKTQPISIETSVKPKVVPMVSPNMKGKIRKPTRGLNDCIAMLTSKLQQKTVEETLKVNTIFNVLAPSSFTKPSVETVPPKMECILRIPTFKTQNIYPEEEETALDLTTKSLNSEKSEETVRTETVLNTSIELSERIKTTLLDRIQVQKVYNSVDQIIEEVAQNTLQKYTVVPRSNWNSIDDTIQKVIENAYSLASQLPQRNTIDDIIDFVVGCGTPSCAIKDVKTVSENNLILNKLAKSSSRKIGSVRKTNKKSESESANPSASIEEGISSKIMTAVFTDQVLTAIATAAVEKTITATLDTNTENKTICKKKRAKKLSHGNVVPKQDLQKIDNIDASLSRNNVDNLPEIVNKAVNDEVDKTSKLVKQANTVHDNISANAEENTGSDLNKAFIESTETKNKTLKHKKGARKMGQVRNRSQSKKKIENVNKKSEKILLETNVDALSDVKEITPHVSPSNPLVGDEGILTKTEEMKQLLNEDEPLLLENKVMTPQKQRIGLPSDSEDDIPLAVLVKPEDDGTKNKEVIESQENMNKTPLSVSNEKDSDNASQNLNELSKTVEENTPPNNTPDAELATKKVTKKRGKTVKGRNDMMIKDQSMNTNIAPNDGNFPLGDLSPGTQQETGDTTAISKEEPTSMENTVRSITMHKNKEETPTEDNRCRKRQKSKSAKRRTDTTFAEPALPENPRIKKTHNSTDSDVPLTEILKDEAIQKINNVSFEENLENSVSLLAENNESGVKLNGESGSNTNTSNVVSADHGPSRKVPKRRSRSIKTKQSRNSKATDDKPKKTEGSTELDILNAVTKENLPLLGINESSAKKDTVDSHRLTECISSAISNDLIGHDDMKISFPTIAECNSNEVHELSSDKNLDSQSDLDSDTPLATIIAEKNTEVVPQLNKLDNEHKGEILEIDADSDTPLTLIINDKNPKEKVRKRKSQSAKRKTEKKTPITKELEPELISIEQSATKTRFDDDRIDNTNLEVIGGISNDLTNCEVETNKKTKPIANDDAVKSDSVNIEEKGNVETSKKNISKRRSRSLKKKNIKSVPINNELQDKNVTLEVKKVEDSSGNIEDPITPVSITKSIKIRGKSLKRKQSESNFSEESSSSSFVDFPIKASEKANMNLLPPEVQFAQPRIGEAKSMRRRSMSIKSNTSSDDISADSLLSDSSLTSNGHLKDSKAQSLETTSPVKPVNTRKKRSRPKRSQTLSPEKTTADIIISRHLTDLNDDSNLSLVAKGELETSAVPPQKQTNSKKNGKRPKATKKPLTSELNVSIEPEIVDDKPFEFKETEQKGNDNVGDLKSDVTLLNTACITNNTDENKTNILNLDVTQKNKNARSTKKTSITDSIDQTALEDNKKFSKNDGKIVAQLSKSLEILPKPRKVNKKRSRSLKTNVPNKIEHLAVTANVITALLTKINDNPVFNLKIKNKRKGRSKSLINPIDTPKIEKPSDDDNIDNKPSRDITVKPKIKRRQSLRNSQKEKLAIIPNNLESTNADLSQVNNLDSSNVLETPSAENTSFESSSEIINSAAKVNKDLENIDKNAVNDSDTPINPFQEPPLKIIINKQKTRRKSKSFKKADLKGQNDLFEDFALVIKKPKRIAPVITYTPADTFARDIYPKYIKQPVEQLPVSPLSLLPPVIPPPLPVPTSTPVPEEEMEETMEDLDASVEEMDMELDEIPIVSNIIERDSSSFASTSPTTNIFAKDAAEIASVLETDNEKEEDRVSPNKNLKNSSFMLDKVVESVGHFQEFFHISEKDAASEEVFQPPIKELVLNTAEEFLYETSTHNNKTDSFLSEVHEVKASKKCKNKSRRTRSQVGESFEIFHHTSNPQKLEENKEINCTSLDNTAVMTTNNDSTAVKDFCFNFIVNKDQETNIERPILPSNKTNELKLNEETATVLEEIEMELPKSNSNSLNSAKNLEVDLTLSDIKIKKNKRKKSKCGISKNILLEKSPDSTSKALNGDSSICRKEKDVDSIYTFTELEDLEIEKPIEIPRRLSRKKTKPSLEPESQFVNEDNVLVDMFDGNAEPLLDNLKNLHNDSSSIVETLTVKPIGKRRSRSGRDLTFDAKESTGEIKENSVKVDLLENGRRKSVRNAKVKALEHIHDDALAELTESERNRDLNRDKLISPEEEVTPVDELTKKKSNRKQSKVQVLECNEQPKENAEKYSLVDNLEELEENVEVELEKEDNYESQEDINVVSQIPNRRQSKTLIDGDKSIVQLTSLESNIESEDDKLVLHGKKIAVNKANKKKGTKRQSKSQKPQKILEQCKPPEDIAKLPLVNNLQEDSLNIVNDFNKASVTSEKNIIPAENVEKKIPKKAKVQKGQKKPFSISELSKCVDTAPTALNVDDLEETIDKELEQERSSIKEAVTDPDELSNKLLDKRNEQIERDEKLLDNFDSSSEIAQKCAELIDFADNITGLEELENSIERELNLELEVTKKTKQSKNKQPPKLLDYQDEQNEDDNINDIMIENFHELRRSRRGSRKVTSYNENDLIDPLLDEIDGKKKSRKKERTDEIPDGNLNKKTKESEKKLNSDELFDLLKASTNETKYVPKTSNTYNNLDEGFSDDNFDNVFENILEKSFLLQSSLRDKNKEDKNIDDKIYEFTESPESTEHVKDNPKLLEVSRKTTKTLSRRNKSPIKPQPDENSDSILNVSGSDNLLSGSDLSVDSKNKLVKADKAELSDKSNYCEICNRSFIRVENLIKHKRTLTHIQKLSEIEAKEAAEKSKVNLTENESYLKESTKIPKNICDISRTEINISDILQDSNKPSGHDSPVIHSSFANSHALKLADIINDVLNKPVLEDTGADIMNVVLKPVLTGGNEKQNSFSDIIMQNATEKHPEYRRYKSLGERKSFDSEPVEPQIKMPEEPYISKTTILEKQISLLENIIENQTGVNYIDDISMSSNNSLENNTRQSSSELSLKQDDSSNVPYTRNNSIKPTSNDDSFLKPSQYEEISEDSVNLRNYEDQKLRKTLNRDEELFLECCSLLKSGSEVSSYSNKKLHGKILSNMGLKQCDEPEWLERKSLVQKPLYDIANEYSDDNSRIPTPLGDSYDDDASNSNTISSNWNLNKKHPVVEDKYEVGRKSFSFEEVLNECVGDRNKEISKNRIGEVLPQSNSQDPPDEIDREPFVIDDSDEELSEKKQEDFSDGSTSDSKKIITKGARKVFEGLKVSIPTEELNLDEVLNCSPKQKKMEMQNLSEAVRLSDEPTSPPTKPSRTARKSKPVKNKSQVGSNLLFKMNKKKVLSPTSNKKKEDNVKTHDIYDFEETQDNTDVFTKPDFRTFRNMKSNEPLPELESDTESHDYLDSFSVEARSITSSISSSSSKKPKTQENITKKKCMIMGRIFKNQAKSKLEDIDEEMRHIPEIDNSELLENYVADCKKIIRNEDVAKPKLSETEINLLFDQLLENKSDTKDTLSTETKPTSKSKPEIKKPDNKKKIKQKNRKRVRTNSDSTDDEFNINKVTKKRAYRKNGKAEDNCINLEQELKECIGVASRKSQRKCTSGKQNVLVEYWSSDESQFEALLETQRLETKLPTKDVEESLEPLQTEPVAEITDVPIEENILEVPKPKLPNEAQEKPLKPKSTDKKPQQKRKSTNDKPKSGGSGKADMVASNRRKRAAANPLYHWSSSSEDESQDLIEVKPIRDELEDDEDRPVQHGWIVGDSPKKLVTMLAQAKGKKTDIDCVKEQGKKRTNAVS